MAVKYKVPEFNGNIDELPRSVGYYVKRCEKHVKFLTEVQEEIVREYSNLEAVAASRKKRLDSIKHEYDAKIAVLRRKLKEKPKIEPSKDLRVLAPTEFYINPEIFDLLKFDLFDSSMFKFQHGQDMQRLLKFSYLFLKPGKKYDFIATLIMMNAYPLESFLIADVHDMTKDFLVESSLRAKVALLRRLGYLNFNMTMKLDNRVRRYYYITDLGRAQVEKFISECRRPLLNIDFYENNFRRAYGLSKEPKGKRSGFVKQYRAVSSESFPRKPKRAKPNKGNSQSMSGEQPIES